MTTVLVATVDDFPPEVIAVWREDGTLDRLIAAGAIEGPGLMADEAEETVREIVRELFNSIHEKATGRFGKNITSEGANSPYVDASTGDVQLDEPITLVRGVQVPLTADEQALVDRKFAPPMTEAEIDQHHDLGPVMVQKLLDYRNENVNGPEAEGSLGTHWTTDKHWASVAADRGGAQGGMPIVVQAQWRGKGFDPSHANAGPTVTWKAESETTLALNAELLVTGMWVGGRTEAWQNVIGEPILVSGGKIVPGKSSFADTVRVRSFFNPVHDKASGRFGVKVSGTGGGVATTLPAGGASAEADSLYRELGMSDEIIAAGISQGISDDPSQLLHGNGFMVVDGKPRPWGTKGGTAIPVHSHSGRNAAGVEVSKEPFSGGDIADWTRNFQKGDWGPRQAVIYRDGTFDVVGITKSTSAGAFGHSEKWWMNELHVPLGNADIQRANVRAKLGGQGFDFREGLRWGDAAPDVPPRRMADVKVRSFFNPRHDRRTGRFAVKPATTIGITPNRGKPKQTIAETEPYYGSSRYKNFRHHAEDDVPKGVTLLSNEKVSGFWEGGLEPSAQIVVKGGRPTAVKAYATGIGKRFNQDGVVAFTPREGGTQRLYRWKVADPTAAVAALRQTKVMGASVHGGRVEVIDLFGSEHGKMIDLGRALGHKGQVVRGDGVLWEKGVDYSEVLVRAIMSVMVSDQRQMFNPNHDARSGRFAPGGIVHAPDGGAGGGAAATRYESRRHAAAAARADLDSLMATAPKDYEGRRGVLVGEGIRSGRKVVQTDDPTMGAYHAEKVSKCRIMVEAEMPKAGDTILVHRVGKDRPSEVMRVGRAGNIDAKVWYDNGVERVVKIPGIPKEFYVDH